MLQFLSECLMQSYDGNVKLQPFILSSGGNFERRSFEAVDRHVPGPHPRDFYLVDCKSILFFRLTVPNAACSLCALQVPHLPLPPLSRHPHHSPQQEQG